MRIIGNLLWWIFGGLEAALGYFTGSLALAITIVGLPAAIQTFKIGVLCLWPFGAEIQDTNSPLKGCLLLPLNLLWIIFGGLWAWAYAHSLRYSPCHYNYRLAFCQATLQVGQALLSPFWQKHHLARLSQQ